MADFSEVFDLLEQLRNSRRAFERAVIATHSEMKERIHGEGVAADGSKIGEYTEGYARFRRKAGRQTSFVDLRYTGQLQGDFVVEPTDFGMQSGFINPDNAKKARWAEANFGKPIFSLTDLEVDNFVKYIVEEMFNE